MVKYKQKKYGRTLYKTVPKFISLVNMILIQV
jgi:hypothetical protein